MAKYTYSNNNFSSGELSSKLEGRSDLKQYASGVSEMLNMIPYRTGGLARRPGTRTVLELVISAPEDTPTAVIDYRVGEEHYIVIIKQGVSGVGIIDIYELSNSGGLLALTAKTVTGTATLIVGEYLPSHVQIGSTLILCDRNGTYPPIVIVKDLTGDTADFNADVYLNHVANLLEASSSGSITKSRFRGVPFQAMHRGDTTITTVLVSGISHTLTASDPIFKDGVNNYPAYIRVKDGAQEWVYRLLTRTSSTVCDVLLEFGPVGVPGVTAEWAFSSWGDIWGYPTSAGYFQGRLVFGGVQNQPDSLWFSFSQNIFLLVNYKLAQDHKDDISGVGYNGAIADSDAFDVLLSANKINTVQWITSDRTLQVGMDTNEHFVSTVDGKLGPRNFNVTTSTFFGSSKIYATRFQNSNYMVEKDGRGLRELTYSDENGSNISRLLSALSDEIVDHGADKEGFGSIKSLEVNKTRSVLWIVTESGDLVGVTVEKATDILAWHKHTITDASIIDIAAVSGVLGKADITLVIAKRGARYFLEYFGGDNEEPTSEGPYTEDNNTVYMDNTIIPILADISVDRIDNLDNFEVGDMVDVLAEGEHLGQFEVESGNYIDAIGVKASGDYSSDTPIQVGFLYTSRLATLPVMAGSQTGDETIQWQRTDTVLLKLYKSLFGQIGSSVDNLEDLDYEDNGPILFTGNKRIQLDSNPGEEQRIIVETSKPYPLNVLSIGMRGLTQD